MGHGVSWLLPCDSDSWAGFWLFNKLETFLPSLSVFTLVSPVFVFLHSFTPTFYFMLFLLFLSPFLSFSFSLLYSLPFLPFSSLSLLTHWTSLSGIQIYVLNFILQECHYSLIFPQIFWIICNLLFCFCLYACLF